MTATVFLVRHVPHTEQDKVQVGRMTDIHWAEGSAEIAQAAADRLKGERLDAVISSSLERARRTAETVAEPHGLAVETDEALLELDFGEWTGRTFEALEDEPSYRQWNAARSLHRPPGGESMLECQARMVGALERARAAHPDGRIAMVSHGDPLKSLILHILGLPLDAWNRFDLDPGSVSAAVVGDWGAKMLFLNERPAV